LTLVGIIANPASGKDIRRLVAHGSVFDNIEKVNIVRRTLLGLQAVGTDKVLYMPDYFGIVPRALENVHLKMSVEPLDMYCEGTQEDSTLAARLMAEEGARCLVVLGGDGTNRAVAKGSVSVPFMSVSTGTNNIFPCMVEGTIAGMAAGFVATGLVPVEDATFPSKRLDVMIDGEAVDLALVDVALYDDIFLGSKAIWDMDRVKELVLTQAKPSNIGLSSVGGMVIDRPMPQEKGLHIILGPSDSDEGFVVTAPVAPGLIKPVRVLEVNEISFGEEVSFDLSPAVIALDGEREVEVLPGKKVSVRLNENGPRVVDIQMTMWLAAKNKAWSAAANEEVSFYGSSGNNA